jgi:hypothetical protein
MHRWEVRQSHPRDGGLVLTVVYLPMTDNPYTAIRVGGGMP